MRIGLGTLRLPADDAVLALRAGIDAGVRLIDTARAYQPGEAVAAAARRDGVRVVTKCGMKEGWVPDGRAGSILDDARESARILGVIDLLLLHAPDPGVPFATSVRALARAKEEGLARAIGLSNVSRPQLEEALAIAPIEAVQVQLDAAARGGLVPFCAERGIEIQVYGLLGGPKKARALKNDPALGSIARGASVAELVIAYVLAVHPALVPIVGPRSAEQAVSAARATSLTLDAAALTALDARFPALGMLRAPPTVTGTAEVVIIMGIAGAGKSTLAARFADHERLNRDTLGGTLKAIAQRLGQRLAAGAQRLVLDNTYLTRASRSDVIREARKHGARVRCVWLDTPLREAKLNAVERMLAKIDRLPQPKEMGKDPVLLQPTALFRMARELEPPHADEGMEIEIVPFARETSGGPGVLIAADSIPDEAPHEGPCLIVAWQPTEDLAAIAAACAAKWGRVVEAGVCDHPAGPPVCWCRPPLPGLWVQFARRYKIDSARSVAIGAKVQPLARAVGIP